MRVRRSSWSSPSLPDGVGSIPLREVCELGTLDFVCNFERYLLADEARVYTKPPKVMVFEDSWEQICRGLLDARVCRLIPKSEVFHLNGQPLLSGLFAVSKEEMCGQWEVYGLIMNDPTQQAVSESGR